MQKAFNIRFVLCCWVVAILFVTIAAHRYTTRYLPRANANGVQAAEAMFTVYAPLGGWLLKQ